MTNLSYAVRLAILATALPIVPVQAHAGIDVQTRTVAPDETEGGAGRLRAQGDRLRIDMDAPPSGQGATSMLYDAKAQVLRILRHRDETYVEIDEAFAQQLAARMNEARKQMEEQLAQMPPQQRALMEKMMEGGALPFPKPGAANQPAPLEAKPSGKEDTVAGTSCTLYDLSRGGAPKGDVCVASWTAIGLEPADLAVVKKLGEFQGKMTESLAGSVPGAEQPFELLDRVDGFPLRTRRTEGGRVVSETYFEDAKEVDVPADVFEIPAGYEKKEMAPAS